KTAEDLMKEMSLNDFLTLVDMAGLNETLQGNLPRGYLSALPKEDLQKLIKYHMVPGKITNDNIVGEHQLDTLSPLAVKIKIMISRKGVTVDKATVDEETRECQDAIIHKIDQVLVPNQNSLVNEISKDTELSEFMDMLHQSGVTEMLLPSGSYTVLAPTNKAFSMLDKKLLQKIIEDPVRLKKFVGRHIISSLILKCNIPEHGIYSTRSMQTDPTDFEFHQRSRRLHVNKHAVAVSNDILTSNGILYKIDHVLPCTCEPLLRTNQGIYISDHRYRRRF
ncbi:transforming growth factor-beta-induced protein ig-h3, partial [Biomphalaria pfeifferi]